MAVDDDAVSDAGRARPGGVPARSLTSDDSVSEETVDGEPTHAVSAIATDEALFDDLGTPDEAGSVQAPPAADEEYFAAPPPATRPRRADPPAARRPSVVDRRAAGRLRARKVRRLVRHVEPWSVLKISLLFYFCLWAILLIAGVGLWSAANSSGTIDNIEKFIRELFALETFQFDGDQIFRASAVGGLVLVVAGTGFNVLMAVLFNLISDLTGGVRITVIEEETARPRPRPRGRRPAVAGAAARRALPDDSG